MVLLILLIVTIQKSLKKNKRGRGAQKEIERPLESNIFIGSVCIYLYGWEEVVGGALPTGTQ